MFMKKKILLCLLFILGVTGCGKTKQDTGITNSYEYDKELMKCLENELGAYLVTEKDDLEDIPLSEIKKSEEDKIAYYKGVFASFHKENKYVIVFPKNGTYEASVMKDFDQYFYEKYSVYQTYESPFTPTIYIHNSNNDVDFEAITNKCVKKSKEEGKQISSEITNKLSTTNKIIIRTGEKELGVIKNKENLTKIVNAISNSKQYGEACLADGHAFEFLMVDNNNTLLDSIYVWHDGNRILPKSLNGCYYSIPANVDLRKIIEEETDYVFYSILDFRENDNQKEQFIYKDKKYNYYLHSENINEIAIKFLLNNQTMTLKYALENNYISAEKVANEYPDLLIKKSKGN